MEAAINTRPLPKLMRISGRLCYHIDEQNIDVQEAYYGLGKGHLYIGGAI